MPFPNELVNPDVPAGVGQAVLGMTMLTLGVWLLGFTIFFLVLYAVVKTAIRRGMRDHHLWVESRQVRSTTGQHIIR